MNTLFSRETALYLLSLQHYKEGRGKKRGSLSSIQRTFSSIVKNTLLYQLNVLLYAENLKMNL